MTQVSRGDLLLTLILCSHQVEDNDHSMVEFAQFRDGVEMRKAAQAVSRRVNRRGDADLLDTGKNPHSSIAYCSQSALVNIKHIYNMMQTI